MPKDGTVTLSIVLFSTDTIDVLPPTVINEITADQAARTFINNMAVQPRQSTAIGKAIERCGEQFKYGPITRQVIDVVTDGGNNVRPLPADATKKVVARGVDAINAIGIDGSSLSSMAKFTWPKDSLTLYPQPPADGFVVKLEKWDTFGSVITAAVRAEALEITSSDQDYLVKQGSGYKKSRASVPGYAIRVSGSLGQQLAILNNSPPMIGSGKWRAVYRKKDVPALRAYQCNKKDNPIKDPTLAYVSANTYIRGIDEVTYDGCSSAFYRYVFFLPQGVRQACVSGKINVDDIGVAFLNGNRISPKVFANDVGEDRAVGGKPILSWPTQDKFGTDNIDYFKPGLNELVFGIVGDASIWEPTGLEFRAKIKYSTVP
jgi:hypothetical protein